MGTVRSSAATAAVLVAGCVPQYDPCFAPDMLVLRPRILAVRGDPPDAPAVLRALVVGPRDSAGATSGSVRLCVPGGFDCDAPQTGAIQDGELRVDLHASDDLLERARAADPLGGYGGTRVEAQIAIDGVDPATKLLVFGTPNEPVELDGVAVTRLDAPAGAYRDRDQAELVIGHTVGLRPTLTRGGETYDVTDLSGHTVELHERVTYAFYSDGEIIFGDLPHGPRGPIAYYGTLDANGALANEPAPDAPAPVNGLVHAVVFGSGVVWIVARDGRGAEAWTTLFVRAVAQPQVPPGDIFACPVK